MKLEKSVIDSACTIRPTRDASQFYAEARKSALRRVRKVFTVIGCFTFLCLASVYGGADHPQSVKLPSLAVLSMIFIAVFFVAFWVVLSFDTKSRLFDLVNAEAAVRRKLVQDLHGAHASSERLYNQLCSELLGAGRLLNQAKIEFSSRRFAPFWDSIEQVAKAFSNARLIVDQLRQLQTEYQRSLIEQNHDFPPLLIGVRSIPADARLISAYSSLIQKAQADIDFALIWEHRQTRSAMVAGFHSLGEMVQSVGGSLNSSIQSLIQIECAPQYAVGITY